VERKKERKWKERKHKAQSTMGSTVPSKGGFVVRRERTKSFVSFVSFLSFFSFLS
jgi:hypothetical protein